MASCFLFAKYLNPEGCLCLKLADDGSILAAAEQRSFSAIRELQQQAKTIVVESTEQASLFEVELPWLADKKARTALPYALEDQLAQTLESLHFAFDRQYYSNKRYLVVIIALQRVQKLIEQMQQESVAFDCITLDWFALQTNEAVLTEHYLLVNSDSFKGAVSPELAGFYLKNTIAEQAYSFPHSPEINSRLAFEQQHEPSVVWLSQRLNNRKTLDLCQGPFQQKQQGLSLKKAGQILGGLAAIWFLSLVVMNLFNSYRLNHHIQAVDQQIAQIYKEFFPEAKQVLSPRFRISRLIEGNSDDKSAHIWTVLSHLSKALEKNPSQIEQLQYQNNQLRITLLSPDFASLERLQQQLKKSSIKLRQTQAATRDKQVIATLELM